MVHPPFWRGTHLELHVQVFPFFSRPCFPLFLFLFLLRETVSVSFLLFGSFLFVLFFFMFLLICLFFLQYFFLCLHMFLLLFLPCRTLLSPPCGLQKIEFHKHLFPFCPSLPFLFHFSLFVLSCAFFLYSMHTILCSGVVRVVSQLGHFVQRFHQLFLSPLRTRAGSGPVRNGRASDAWHRPSLSPAG